MQGSRGGTEEGYMPFRFERLAISGVVLIEPRAIEDERGFFMETYKHSEFAAAGIRASFVQENHSRSVRATLRGLHYQRPPHSQAKLVRVVSGAVFDVAVDIGKGSPTCGKWVGVTLSAENRYCLFVPPWCAHGFCVLSDVAEVVYKVTGEYAPDFESGFMWNDPRLKIEWPVQTPVLSGRDGRWPAFVPVDELFPRELTVF
jgi:dTDP-4-dehydrorhamnose 3,5-epimerase